MKHVQAQSVVGRQAGIHSQGQCCRWPSIADHGPLDLDGAGSQNFLRLSFSQPKTFCSCALKGRMRHSACYIRNYKCRQHTAQRCLMKLQHLCGHSPAQQMCSHRHTHQSVKYTPAAACPLLALYSFAPWAHAQAQAAVRHPGPLASPALHTAPRLTTPS